MPPLATCLAVENVATTVEFLERAFGFSRGVTLPGEAGPRYAEMRHGASAIMLVPRGDRGSAPGDGGGTYAYVEDLDRALARVRDAGAAVGEPEDTPWGDRVAAVTDRDGHRWLLATFRKLAPLQGEGERRSGLERRTRERRRRSTL